MNYGTNVNRTKTDSKDTNIVLTHAKRLKRRKRAQSQRSLLENEITTGIRYGYGKLPGEAKQPIEHDWETSLVTIPTVPRAAGRLCQMIYGPARHVLTPPSRGNVARGPGLKQEAIHNSPGLRSFDNQPVNRTPSSCPDGCPPAGLSLPRICSTQR